MSCELGDLVDASSSVDRKARKDHECDECRCWIRKGEHYKVENWLSDGSWSSQKVCADCLALRGVVFKECGGAFIYGGLAREADELRADGDPAPLAQMNAYRKARGKCRPLWTHERPEFEKRT